MSNDLVTTIEHKQPQLVQLFSRVIQQRRLAHAYLFAGMDGAGQLELATWVAMRLFCLHPTDDGAPDGTCQECQRILTRQHPDVVQIEPDGKSIHVDQVRYLKAEFSKSAVEGNRKVFIISAADQMTAGAANSLLKFIEEPSGTVNAFLLTTNRNLMLPTIVSRTQVVEFPPLSSQEFQAELESRGIDPVQSQVLQHITNSATTAAELLKDDWLAQTTQQLWQWFQQVVGGKQQSFVTVQTNLVGLAKDTNQQKICLDLVTGFFQDALLQHYDLTSAGDLSFPQYQRQLGELAANLTSKQLLTATELSLKAKQQLNSNINFQNVLEGLTLQLWPIFIRTGNH